MPLLRLLSASIITIACVVPVAAQSPAVALEPARPIPVPPLSTSSVPLLLQSQPPASPPLFVLPKPHTVVLSANNTGPCYTLRTYGYTPRDLESNSPKPSSYSTCTPAAPHAFKGAAATISPPASAK